MAYTSYKVLVAFSDSELNSMVAAAIADSTYPVANTLRIERRDGGVYHYSLAVAAGDVNTLSAYAVLTAANQSAINAAIATAVGGGKTPMDFGIVDTGSGELYYAAVGTVAEEVSGGGGMLTHAFTHNFATDGAIVMDNENVAADGWAVMVTMRVLTNLICVDDDVNLSLGSATVAENVAKTAGTTVSMDSAVVSRNPYLDDGFGAYTNSLSVALGGSLGADITAGTVSFIVYYQSFPAPSA